MVERSLSMREVPGSIPGASKIILSSPLNPMIIRIIRPRLYQQQKEPLNYPKIAEFQ
jgi:hypothetical protein